MAASHCTQIFNTTGHRERAVSRAHNYGMKRTLGIRNEFELYDESFTFLILGNAWVDRLYCGTVWAEGPVYFADGDYLLWSSTQS